MAVKEELEKQRDLIQKKIAFFRESLPILEGQKRDLEQEGTKLLTDLSLESDSKVQATLQKHLQRIEEEGKVFNKRVAETISTVTGLEQKLSEVERSLRVSEQAGHETEYHEIKERLFNLPQDIKATLEELQGPVAKLLFLAEEFYKLKEDWSLIYNSFDNFLKTEGITEISENVNLESLTRDLEAFESFKKDMLVLAGKIVDFDVNKSNLRRVVALLGGS